MTTTNIQNTTTTKKAATPNPIFEAAMFEMVKGTKFEKLFTPAAVNKAA